MKRFFILNILGWCFSLQLLALCTFPLTHGSSGKSSSYEALWKVEQKQEADGLPQSAYQTARQILMKAVGEGHKGQALCARLRMAALHQEWAPDSFFTDVAELERLRASEHSFEAEAIYASILAQLYSENRYRSQAHNLTLTSEDMHEWSIEQYDSAATANYILSLQPLDVLSRARTKEWLPLMEIGKQSEDYNHDLLHVLWNRVRDGLDRVQAADSLKECFQKVLRTYQLSGRREAELLLMLDSLDIFPFQGANRQQMLISRLLDLRERFSSLPLCAEVYSRLIDTDTTLTQKEIWAREAIARYSRYSYINKVRNQLNRLRQPFLNWSGEQVCYPGKEYRWPLDMRHVKDFTLITYSLHTDFDQRRFNETASDKQLDYIKAHGHIVQTTSKVVSGKTTDTLSYIAPDLGHYAIVLSASSKEDQVEKKQITDLRLFSVTRLMLLSGNIDNQRLSVIVVDRETGQPVSGALVSVLTDVSNKKTLRQVLTTDAYGRATYTPNTRRENVMLQVSKDADTYLPGTRRWLVNWGTNPESTETKLRLYTDRSLYRPGQTVHVSGIVYSQQHWETRVLPNESFELSLRDVNNKELLRRNVNSDEWGAFSTDFILPQQCLPGMFSVETSKGGTSFRVEEYKRPTFDITMDEAPAIQWPQDTITLTGQAMGFNGVPVRHARVTGRYQFNQPFYYSSPNAWRIHIDNPLIDTVFTDTNGRFSVRVPLSACEDNIMRRGIQLKLNVEVLSSNGETQQGNCIASLCSTPLRLITTLNKQQERSQLTPPSFTLLSSTGKPIAGTIRWSLLSSSDSVLYVDTLALTTGEGKATTFVPVLQQLPSGVYRLKAEAQVDNYSATDSAEVHFFSLDDTRLAAPAERWFYSPSDTFDITHPAILQVGSSEKNVNLYYTIQCKDGILLDTLIHFSDSVITFKIPYHESYGDGISVNCVWVKHEKGHSYRKSFVCRLPEKHLQYRWTSFRDRLYPGQQETWTLHVSNPDGTPASAHVMATLYDASLDAIYAHSWPFGIVLQHSIPSFSWHYTNWRMNTIRLHFPMKEWKVPEYEYDKIHSRWTDGLSFWGGGRSFGRVYKTMRLGDARPLMASAPTMQLNEVAVESVSAETYDTVESDALQGKIAGLDVSKEEYVREDGTTEIPMNVTPRSNFNETAAFFPHLLTDEKGNVSLRFTLPETLTTWKLMGIAHTSEVNATTFSAQALAQKELMAHLNMPRFIRVGDKAELSANIQNLSDVRLQGDACLEIFEPETDKVLSRQKHTFQAEAHGETIISFPISHEDPTVLGVRLTATTDQFSDGEQYFLPVLTDDEWITESVEILTALQAPSAQDLTTDLTQLFNHNSSSATQRRLTVEYTAHPIWWAVTALPSLSVPQHDDILSLASAFYANALAAHIAQKVPQLKTMLELWKAEAQQGQAGTVSPLAMNAELKQQLLDETPWLRDADNDTQRRQQLITLFDASALDYTLSSLIGKLQQRQEADGGFAWFPGMSGSEYMTRCVALLLTRLQTLCDGSFCVSDSETALSAQHVLRRATSFLATQKERQVAEMRRSEQRGVKIYTSDLATLQYIYITQHSEAELSRQQKTDVQYLLNHLRGTVGSINNECRAMAAIVLATAGRQQEAQCFLAALKEHMTTTERQGTFFDYASGSFTSINRKVHTQVAAMECMRTLEPSDEKLNSDMRRWLLQQKRTQMWNSPMESADAIYALLYNQQTDIEDTSVPALRLAYARGNNVNLTSTAKTTASFGYVKTTLQNPAPVTSITLSPKNRAKGWGAVYAQYLSPASEVQAHSNGLNVRREVSDATPDKGDRIVSRFVITADRDYEYVCMSVQRPACAEPESQISGYRYQGGLGYYMAMHDSRTDYFFSRLPKGTYVLETSDFIERNGTYSSGLCRIQCMYAPEFCGHTSEQVLQVKHK